MAEPLFLGLDFGTESVRAIIVDRAGAEHGSTVAPFAHGQITPVSRAARTLFDEPLPPRFALQHPDDWVNGAAEAVRQAIGGDDSCAKRIAGIGVDFTSCTMLPCAIDGTPLFQAHDSLARSPHAYPKLWKHHGAIDETERLNRVALDRREPWLAHYGGIIGLEWLWPKIFEVMHKDRAAFDAAEVWLEAGDWFVWRLVGGEAGSLPRSTCQAGYKACCLREYGHPSNAFLETVEPGLSNARKKVAIGRMIAPGEVAGALTGDMARRFGLRAGIPVSAAIIDAHAGVPGAGVGEAGTLVMVLGTSGCHMLLSEREVLVPGIAGIVRDGILPGFIGYETGQAAMGDAFDWVRRVAGHADHRELERAARDIPAGADGVLALDWFNGCRTPLMDGSLRGAVTGLTLEHTAAHLYRATLEASAMGLRWIVDTLREGGVPVERFVATGGLPHHNPLFIEIIASVLGAPVTVHGAAHGPALGAAILGACAAGAFGSVHEAIESMAGSSSRQPPPRIVQPNAHHVREYDALYQRYRRLAEVMRVND